LIYLLNIISCFTRVLYESTSHINIDDRNVKFNNLEMIPDIFCTFAPDNESLKQADGSATGVLWYANHGRM